MKFAYKYTDAEGIAHVYYSVKAIKIKSVLSNIRFLFKLLDQSGTNWNRSEVCKKKKLGFAIFEGLNISI